MTSSPRNWIGEGAIGSCESFSQVWRRSGFWSFPRESAQTSERPDHRISSDWEGVGSAVARAAEIVRKLCPAWVSASRFPRFRNDGVRCSIDLGGTTSSETLLNREAYVAIADGRTVGQKYDVDVSAGDTLAWKYALHSGQAFRLIWRWLVFAGAW